MPRLPQPGSGDLAATHTPDAIRRRLASGPDHSYLKDFIYGAIDGAVTTFAVVSGVAGADLALSIVVILGVANLIADGFSMAASNFLGTRAEEQQRHLARRTEEHHIKTVPEGEREEIRQIFAAKGFAGEDLERVVDVITADPQRWIETMLTEEHGLARSTPSALRAAFTTFFAFLLVGFLPVFPFVWLAVFGELGVSPYLLSTVLTAVAFVAVGAMKAKFIQRPWHLAGLETLAVGGVAAGIAYGIGFALRAVATGV